MRAKTSSWYCLTCWERGTVEGEDEAVRLAEHHKARAEEHDVRVTRKQTAAEAKNAPPYIRKIEATT